MKETSKAIRKQVESNNRKRKKDSKEEMQGRLALWQVIMPEAR